MSESNSCLVSPKYGLRAQESLNLFLAAPDLGISNSQLHLCSMMSELVCSALEGAATLLDDICEAVEACSIPVEQVHAESGPGQFELATAPGVGELKPP